MADHTKRRHGQYYTRRNPFHHTPIAAWLQRHRNHHHIEPFAGAAHLVDAVEAATNNTRNWSCWDIAPTDPRVTRHNTLTDPWPTTPTPTCIITNPPYLARNIARRHGHHDIADLCNPWDNLYKRCLATCLEHTTRMAAIVPESFISSSDARHGPLAQHLTTVIRADHNLFDDTDMPAAIALWEPTPTPQPVDVWDGNQHIGTLDTLTDAWPNSRHHQQHIHFNRTDGQLGIHGVDGTGHQRIHFTRGDTITHNVDTNSRYHTRIAVTGPAAHLDIDELVNTCNTLLDNARRTSHDVGLTAFMGRRNDGAYRRRIPYRVVRGIIDTAIEHHTNNTT